MRENVWFAAPLSLGFVLAFGGCSSPSGYGATTQLIVGDGTTATAYPEAVLVEVYAFDNDVSGCSGSVIAPQVVLTAGHCIADGNAWLITAPYLSNAPSAMSSRATTFDYKSDGDRLNPNAHDIGLIFLDTPIALPGGYPALSQAPLAGGSSVINIGRINNGKGSATDLFVGPAVPVGDASSIGYPFDYVAEDIAQVGDSGGAAVVPGSSPHLIAAVASGMGNGQEVLARVDLLFPWIDRQIAAHGGGEGGGGTVHAVADAGAGPTPEPSGEVDGGPPVLGPDGAPDFDAEGSDAGA